MQFTSKCTGQGLAGERELGALLTSSISEVSFDGSPGFSASNSFRSSAARGADSACKISSLEGAEAGGWLGGGIGAGAGAAERAEAVMAAARASAAASWACAAALLIAEVLSATA